MTIWLVQLGTWGKGQGTTEKEYSAFDENAPSSQAERVVFANHLGIYTKDKDHKEYEEMQDFVDRRTERARDVERAFK